MIITDYERSVSLRDVAISLTRDEAEELSLYLKALLTRPEANAVYLSEVRGGAIQKDLRFSIDRPRG